MGYGELEIYRGSKKKSIYDYKEHIESMKVRLQNHLLICHNLEQLANPMAKNSEEDQLEYGEQLWLL